MNKISQPHIETKDHNYIDLKIENIPNKERVGYLEDFINDIFDIDGYYFKDLNYDDQNRIFYIYEHYKNKKMNGIKYIKLSLMMSNGFMQMWKNPEKYRKFIERYAEDIRKNKGSVSKTDKIYEEKNYLNDFDFETIHKDYERYRYGKPLSNETGFNSSKENESKQSETEEKKEEPIQYEPEPNYDAGENEVPKNVGTKEKNKEEELKDKIDDDVPYYDTEKVPVKKLEKGDVMYINDDWWIVIKKSRMKVWVQHIWDKKIKTFRKDPNEKVEILTDESINKMIEEFREANLENKLPKQLKF